MSIPPPEYDSKSGLFSYGPNPADEARRIARLRSQGIAVPAAEPTGLIAAAAARQRLRSKFGGPPSYADATLASRPATVAAPVPPPPKNNKDLTPLERRQLELHGLFGGKTRKHSKRSRRLKNRKSTKKHISRRRGLSRKH